MNNIDDPMTSGWKKVFFDLGAVCTECQKEINLCYMYTGIHTSGIRWIDRVVCLKCYNGEEG